MKFPEKPGSQTRRELLQAGLAGGVSVAALGSAVPTDVLAAEATAQIDRTSEAIHQEVTFERPPDRVYAALTDAGMFHQVTLLSAAMRGAMSNAIQPTQISGEPGGALTLFGGHIVGRQIELILARRIVQAWRVVDWPSGVYSIARFELLDRGPGTQLVFDHSGFPKGAADHLAQGWKANYWEPLQKFLS